jgi:hypothetical protein
MFLWYIQVHEGKTMSFSDWDTFVNDSPNNEISVQLTAPIEGDQSLRYRRVSGVASQRGNIVVKDVSGLTKGVTAGRLRTIWRREAGFSSASDAVSIIAMQSFEDLSNGTGNFYHFKILGTGATELRKITGGALVSSGTLLGTGPGISITTGVVFTAELMWFFDLAEFGGIKLQAKVGTDPGFGDLGLEIDVLDLSTPHSISVAEGLGFLGASGSSMDVVADTTTLYTVGFE